jgi:iron complex transport system ATP-binding protein
MLRIENITYAINKHPLIKNLSFSIRCGEVVAVLGANGAGKSTLIRMLSGDKKASLGNIVLNGKDITQYDSAELALKRAVMSQSNVMTVDFLVKEVVMMGRYPHYLNNPAANDKDIVQQTMSLCGVKELEDRSILTLSGGEQQRVQLARVLAQIWDCPGALLLMDEPVANMDLQYQQQTLAIVAALAKRGFMVITVLHDINLASQYADRILLLKNGRKWNDGTPAEVLNAKNVYNIFAIEAEVILNTHTLKPFVMPKEVRLYEDALHLDFTW